MEILYQLLYSDNDYLKEKSNFIIEITKKVNSHELSRSEALELLNDIKNSDDLINLACDIKLKDLFVNGLVIAISSMNF